MFSQLFHTNGANLLIVFESVEIRCVPCCLRLCRYCCVLAELNSDEIYERLFQQDLSGSVYKEGNYQASSTHCDSNSKELRLELLAFAAPRDWQADDVHPVMFCVVQLADTLPSGLFSFACQTGRFCSSAD